jgi:hypothetical protein
MKIKKIKGEIKTKIKEKRKKIQRNDKLQLFIFFEFKEVIC